MVSHQDYDVTSVHGHGCQVVGVLLVPGQPQERCVLRVLVDDGRVLQVTKIEHTDGAYRNILSLLSRYFTYP